MYASVTFAKLQPGKLEEFLVIQTNNQKAKIRITLQPKVRLIIMLKQNFN